MLPCVCCTCVPCRWVARLEHEQQKLENRGISLLAYDAVAPPKMRTPARLRGRQPVAAGTGVRSASMGPPVVPLASPQAILPPWRPGQSSLPSGTVEPTGWQEEPHQHLQSPSHKSRARVNHRADAKAAAFRAEALHTKAQRPLSPPRPLSAPLTSGRGGGAGAGGGRGGAGGGDGGGRRAGGAGCEGRDSGREAGSDSPQGSPETSKHTVGRDGAGTEGAAAAAFEAWQTTERRQLVLLQRPSSAAQVAKGKSNVTAIRIARLSSPAPIFHLGQPGLSNCILLGPGDYA